MKQIPLEIFIKNIKNEEEALVTYNGIELFIYTQNKDNIIKFISKKRNQNKDSKCTEK